FPSGGCSRARIRIAFDRAEAARGIPACAGITPLSVSSASYTPHLPDAVMLSIFPGNPPSAMKPLRPQLRVLIFKLAVFSVLLSLPCLVLVESGILVFEFGRFMAAVEGGALAQATQ